MAGTIRPIADHDRTQVQRKHKGRHCDSTANSLNSGFKREGDGKKRHHNNNDEMSQPNPGPICRSAPDLDDTKCSYSHTRRPPSLHSRDFIHIPGIATRCHYPSVARPVCKALSGSAGPSNAKPHNEPSVSKASYWHKWSHIVPTASLRKSNAADSCLAQTFETYHPWLYIAPWPLAEKVRC